MAVYLSKMAATMVGPTFTLALSTSYWDAVPEVLAVKSSYDGPVSFA